MDTTKLTTVISLLVALSIASERLVDIIKGLVPWLNQQRRKPAEEGWRKAALQVIAVFAGITTAWLAGPAVPAFLPPASTGKWALVLLASGGSGSWNSFPPSVTRANSVTAPKPEGGQIDAEARNGPSPS